MLNVLRVSHIHNSILYLLIAEWWEIFSIFQLEHLMQEMLALPAQLMASSEMIVQKNPTLLQDLLSREAHAFHIL